MGGFAFYDSEDKFRFHLWDQRFCKRSEAKDSCDEQLGQLKQLHPTPNGRDQYQSPLEYCVANKLIVMTEGEIENLGHTDLIAKTIAIFQTLYFIANCIARGVSGLAITELEFFTLGFAVLNLVIYSLWWHKPSRVRFPVRVMSRPMTMSPQQSSHSMDQDEEPNSRVPDRVGTPAVSQSMPSEAGALGTLERMLRAFRDPGGLIRLPVKVARELFKYAWNPDSSHSINLEHGNILPAGHSEEDEDHAFALMLSAAIILGVFHCVPIMLNYHDFPDHTKDHHLWTIFALLITVLPYGAPMAASSVLLVELEGGMESEPLMRKIFIWIGLVTLFSCILLYATARIALIALAVKQVADLPPSALQQVKWTTLIPHFGV
ncbi:hypothetical protein AAF712_006752 [Marasmius tenuissimus]|uniref:Uncharacterized protein n=1 Tax=Marasmius tenuissimus TaxID=585030 RepID=A0ABR2ZXK7_9AGAR